MRLHTIIHLLAVAAVAIALGVWLEQQLAAPVVFGGMVCETTVVDGEAIRGCFGYPPTGILVLFLAVGVVSLPVEWYFRQ